MNRLLAEVDRLRTLHRAMTTRRDQLAVEVDRLRAERQVVLNLCARLVRRSGEFATIAVSEVRILLHADGRRT